MMICSWQQKKLLYLFSGTIIGILIILVYEKTMNPLCSNQNVVRHVAPRENLGFPSDNQTDYTMRKRLPDALVIGVMKCGTDALRAFLKLHPDIAMSPYEPNYWCEHFHKGYEYYINEMAKSTLGQITIEKSTCFTHRRAYSPRRVYYYDRNIKMIVMVREPIQRALSQFTLDKYRMFKAMWNATFDQYVMDPEKHMIDIKSPYLQRSLYYVHTMRWMAYFKLDNFLFLDTDEFKREPIKTLEKIENFLEIGNFNWANVLYFDQNRGFYCYVIDGLEMCLGSDKGVQHETMKPITEKKLQKFFRTQNKLFFKLIRQKFNWIYDS